MDIPAILKTAFIPGYADRVCNRGPGTQADIGVMRHLRICVLSSAFCAVNGLFMKRQLLVDSKLILAGAPTAAEIGRALVVSKVFIVAGTVLCVASVAFLLVFAAKLQNEKNKE